MLRTKSGLPEHCYWQIDRHGKRRVRFRKGAFSTYLTGTPWSEHFMRQHAAALDGVRAQTESVGAGRIKAGSVDALIVSYRRSIFPTLAPSTRKTRGYILERFGREHGALPVNRLEREHVDAIFKAMANTPPTANNLLKILRHLLEHAITLGMIAQIRPRGSSRSRSKATVSTSGARPRSRALRRSTLSAHLPISRCICCSIPGSGVPTWCAWASSTHAPTRSPSAKRKQTRRC